MYWHHDSSVEVTSIALKGAAFHVSAAVVNDPAKYKGQIVPVVGEHISYPEIADTISSVTGKTVK